MSKPEKRRLNKQEKVSRMLNILLIIAFLVILFPDVSGINRISPSLMGLPFFVFMELIIALLIAVIIIAQYFLKYGKENSK